MDHIDKQFLSYYNKTVTITDFDCEVFHGFYKVQPTEESDQGFPYDQKGPSDGRNCLFKCTGNLSPYQSGNCLPQFNPFIGHGRDSKTAF